MTDTSTVWLTLATLSPFYFVVDRGHRVVAFGPSLGKLCPGLSVNHAFSDHLVLRRPDAVPDFDVLAASGRQLCLIETVATGAFLRGAVQPDGSERLVFIGSPWLTSASEVERLGLTISDFALHDPALDLLEVLQIQRQTNADLHQLNQRLAAAKLEAEAAARAKSSFLAQISHELRTPMNAVIGLTGILIEDQGLSAEQRDLVQTIRTSGGSLLAIINEVLDFSKIESGRVELDDAPYAVRPCAEDALDVVSVDASRKGLDLAYWLDPSSPPALRGDGTRVRQILVNLLANAVKFTDRGRVTLRGGPTEDGSHFLWLVEDTGVGIPAPRLQSIFDPFEQASTGILRRGEGTGLGLTISRRLAEAMGGTLTVESELGLGSRFALLLPAKPATTTSVSSLPPGTFNDLGVIIYEPRSGHGRQLVQLAEALGTRVTWATDLQRLGTASTAGRCDVVLACVDTEAELRSLVDHGLPATARLIACVPPDLRCSCQGLPTLRKPVRADALARALVDSAAVRPTTLPRASSRLESMATLRVLLAEDSVVNQKVARLQLSRLGITPDVVSNGREALAAVERRDYDVVLMDVQMPELDGIEATRRIRELPLRQPRIVALTAAVFDDEREVCRRAGMEDFVSKPIDSEVLAHVLSRCANLRAASVA